MMTAVLACLAAVASPGASALPLNASERAFAAEVLASESRLASVWPGFTMPKDALLIHFPGRGSLLIGHPGQPPGFRALDDAERRLLGETGPRRLSGGDDRKPPITTTFSTDFDLGGVKTFVLVYDPGRELREQLSLLHHESFHQLQLRDFSHGAGARERHPAETPELVALRRVEAQLLLRAMGDPEGFIELTRSFIAVREERYSRAPAGTREWEDAFERHEGLAEYAGQRAALPPGIGPASAAAALAPNLSVPLFAGSEAGREGTMYFYGTGAAQALLLDRLRAPWKERAAGGQGPFAALEDAFPVSDASSRAKRALAEAGWESLTAWERTRGGQTAQAGVETDVSFEAAAGLRLVLRSWETRGVNGLSTSGSPPRSIPGGTLYPSLSAAELSGIKGLHATFRDTSVLQRSGKDARPSGRMTAVYPTEFVAILGDKPDIELVLDGQRRNPPPNETAFSRLVLRTPKATVEARRPGRIHLKGSELSIELDPESR